MLYRVFNTQEEVCQANQSWNQARNLAGIHDKLCCGQIVNPQITTCWDRGREMLDGRFACQVLDMFGDEFGGIEMELSDEEFPQAEGV